MKVPEKIYTGENGNNPMLKRHCDSDVEYIRTDAFIKKAKEFFIRNVNIPQDVSTNEDGEPLADSYIKYAKARLDAANEIFEDFKAYMKGE